MGQKGFVPLAILLLVGALSFMMISKWQIRNSKSTVSVTADSGKLRGCPDKWYADGKEEEMFISGVRRETKDFDLDWIKDNCSISQPEVFSLH